jgi:ABC-2 type transport system ATP-binding protein
MTVNEYLNFVYDLKSCSFEREDHLAEILSVVKLTDVKDRLIKNLSKGYKQRVGIAQALIGDPKLIIFDEPTVGLDPKQILEVRNLIRTLGKKHTVILSTHILAEVQAVCERVIIINKGKVIADARTEDITKTIEDGYAYEVRIAAPARDAVNTIKKINGVKNADTTGQRDADAWVINVETAGGVDIRKSLFNLCVKNGWPMIGLAPTGTDLESVFIKLVDRSDRKKNEGAGRRRSRERN